jgi:protein-tyrosine phosphatase
VIDLHSHILPGLDDGAPDLAVSEAMARLAIADGVATMVATPHVREDFPYPLEAIAARTREVNDHLRARGVNLQVRAAGEVAVTKLLDLDDEVLQLRGFRAMLAHPERSPSFQKDPSRLATLVDRGVLCSITGASMAGRFGRTVQRCTQTLFERGLVHNVASDAHDVMRRPPGLLAGFRVLDRELPGLLAEADWYTQVVPAAVLAGEALPSRPPLVAGRKRRPWSRAR